MIIFIKRWVPNVGDVHDVFLEGKKVGTIHRVVGGYQYQTGKFNGQILPTLEEVKQSLILD